MHKREIYCEVSNHDLLVRRVQRLYDSAMWRVAGVIQRFLQVHKLNVGRNNFQLWDPVYRSQQ